MPPKDIPVFGASYSYDDVANFYKHDATLVSFVIVKGPKILALRLREDYNPQIIAKPAEVWVGERPPPVRDWGNTLAHDTARAPLFVKQAGNTNYTFVGDHEVLPRIPTLAKLTEARANVPHDRGISRIVFLRKL